jgi:Stress responsive A/B Barrel Domain
MPIQHVVMFRFNEGTDESAVDELAAGLRRLPGLIPQIATYVVGPDLGLTEGSWDFALSARFATVADFETYRAHPEHQAVLTDHIDPITAERRSVQFEF